jgi:peptidoglycan lytic transglycosylase
MEAARTTRRRPAPRRASPGGRRPRQGTRNRKPSRTQFRRRRWGLGVGAAILLGVLAGALISSGVFDRALREITLPLRHDDIIRQQAADKDVDASLIAAVIYAESRFHDQTSHAGARGLMQVTPATAMDIERRSGGTTFKVSDLSDPQINISYGTFYLRELLDRYGGNEVAALAAYNAGPANADDWGGRDLALVDIPTAETRAYVAEVLGKQRDYRDKYPRELGY